MTAYAGPALADRVRVTAPRGRVRHACFPIPGVLSDQLEIFGPVVAVFPFDTLDEAVAIANATSYGLSAGMFTRSLDTAWTMARRLQAGQVYVNQWFSPGVLEAPGHGYKRSGYGGVGIEKYTQRKEVFFRVTEPGS